MRETFVAAFDRDGYPTEETLNYVASLGPNMGTPDEIIEYIFSIWHWGDMMGKYDKEKGCFEISTGGWSGNESIITALEKSFFWCFHWYQSRAGGHYWFKVKSTRP